MHPELLIVMTDPELSDAAKRLFAHVYAYTNGRLETVIDRDEALTLLRVSEGTLRRTRRELFEAGYMRSRVRGGDLECEIEERGSAERHERAVGARSCHENAHLLRVGDGENAHLLRGDEEPDDAKRAPTARNAHLLRVSGDEERAPTARCLPRAERENGDFSPPTPPYTELVNMAGRQDKYSATSRGGAGGSPATERTAELLAGLGLAPATAGRLRGLAFEPVARHVAAWQRSRRNGKGLGVGALVNQIESWPVPIDVTAADLQDGLLAERVTDDDLDEWGVERPRNGLEAYTVPPEWERYVQH